MPEITTPETEEFRLATIIDYFADMTEYAHSKGLTNAVCVMLAAAHGISLETIDRICSLPHLDDIGSDPYWGYTGVNPYEFVLNGARRNIEVSDKFGKDHNIWIQTYNVPRGREEEIIEATAVIEPDIRKSASSPTPIVLVAMTCTRFLITIIAMP